MDPEQEQTITIVGSPAGSARKRGVLERTVAVDQVREHFVRFMDSLKAIIDVEVPAVGDYTLDEIQFSAEITANGEFKLVGTGVGLEATSGVTFTLRRVERPGSMSGGE